MAKKKFYKCKFIELEYDDLGRYRWCHNEMSGCRECMCNDIFKMNSCPFFERMEGDKGKSFDMSDQEKEEVKKFLDDIEKRNKENEMKERALLDYLKKKYER